MAVVRKRAGGDVGESGDVGELGGVGEERGLGEREPGRT